MPTPPPKDVGRGPERSEHLSLTEAGPWTLVGFSVHVKLNFQGTSSHTHPRYNFPATSARGPKR